MEKLVNDRYIAVSYDSDMNLILTRWKQICLNFEKFLSITEEQIKQKNADKWIDDISGFGSQVGSYESWLKLEVLPGLIQSGLKKFALVFPGYFNDSQLGIINSTFEIPGLEFHAFNSVSSAEEWITKV